jgi:hypothetical protein
MSGARLRLYLLVFISLFMQMAVANEEISREELERWFNSNTTEPPRYKEVNDGQLVFLTGNHDPALHHHYNTLTILPDSLQTGWVLLEQCHQNIDKVPAAEILFKADRVRDIKITKSINIDKSWIEGTSVQMENIQANAQLCLQAYSHSLTKKPDGTFSMRNGPFMRRFFDGYFPIRVSLVLNFAQTNLELTSFTPHDQAGFHVVNNNGILQVDTVFEGKLQTEFQFKTKKL